MEAVQDTPAVEEVVTEQQAPSERERIEQEAIQKYRDSQKTQEEKANEVPEGYNEDGTPKEELIDGKFKSQEDLLKAYKELEKKFSQPKEETTTDTTPEKEETTQTDEVTNNEGVKVDVSKFNAEFAENGQLSDASYSELETLGFAKRDVDLYIEGQKALAGKFTNDVYGVVGGEEQYAQVTTWAQDNIDPSVIKEYNDALANLDTATATRHLEYMNMKMQQAQPAQTRRIEGSSSETGVQPFASKAEWFKAQDNRLYGKDAAYTKMVDNRYLVARKKGLI